MKTLRETVLAGALRTPFVLCGTSFNGTNRAGPARLLMGELIFRSGIEPSDIDTVILASSVPLAPGVAEETARACRDLGCSANARLIPISAGTASDLLALSDAVARISVGESDAAIVLGMGVVDGDPDRFLCDLERFPSYEVAKNHPSSFPERTEYVRGSIERVRNAERSGKTAGLVPILLPPYFEEPVDQDNIVTRENMLRADVETGEPHSTAVRTSPMFDYRAVLRDGFGALIVSTRDIVDGVEQPVRTITGIEHIGVPGDQRGEGSILALERLIAGKRKEKTCIDILEIGELTAAQSLAAVNRFRAVETAMGESGSPGEGVNGRTLINPGGGALAYGLSPSSTGIRMLAGLTESLEREGLGCGALAFEGPEGDAFAVLLHCY